MALDLLPFDIIDLIISDDIEIYHLLILGIPRIARSCSLEFKIKLLRANGLEFETKVGCYNWLIMSTCPYFKITTCYGQRADGVYDWLRINPFCHVAQISDGKKDLLENCRIDD